MTLSASVRDGLFAHAREPIHVADCGTTTSTGTPASDRLVERCGILAGRAGDESPGSPHVSTHRRITNVAGDPHRAYELDPTETLRAIEECEAAGDALLGFYHSHPHSPAEPSPTDRRQARWPGFLYAIVSVPDADLAVFEWTGERFESRPLRVVEP